MSEVPIGRPEDVVAAFVEAWNQRDPDALAALFDSDAEFVNVTGLWWHTREDQKGSRLRADANLQGVSTHSDRRPRQIAQPKLHSDWVVGHHFCLHAGYGIDLVNVRPPLSTYAHGC